MVLSGCPTKSIPTSNGTPSVVSSNADSTCDHGGIPFTFDQSFLETIPKTIIPSLNGNDADGCQTLYYVDATGGNDAWDGRSPSTAWRTVSRINQSSFLPGTGILFKRGEKWEDSALEIKSSGQPGQPILLGAFGVGALPILSARGLLTGWDVAENWECASSNLWSIPLESDAGRVWLDDRECLEAVDGARLDADHPWYYDDSSKRLLIFSPENPARHFSKIDISDKRATTLCIAGSDYVTLRHLDVRGGTYAVGVYGANHVVMEDSRIGRDSSSMGVFVCQKAWPPQKEKSDYGVIRRCIVDSGDRLRHDYDRSRTEDGIHLRSSSNHWEIFGNEIRDWGHTGTSLWQDAPNTTVSYNRVYSNLFTSEDISYGRGVSTQGQAGGCQYNEFFHNLIIRTSAANQIGGEYNAFYENVIDTVVNSPQKKTWGTGKGISVTPILLSNSNRISKNIIYNCDEAGIRIEDWQGDYSIQKNTVENNVIVDCGLRALENPGCGLVVWPPNVSREPTARENIFRNNLVYTEGVHNVIAYRETSLCPSKWNATASFGDVIEGNVQRKPVFVSPQNGDFHFSWQN